MSITEEMLKKTATGLKLSDLRKRRVITEEWTPKLRYAWDNGPAIGRYLAELKNGRIVARTCRKCRRTKERFWSVRRWWSRSQKKTLVIFDPGTPAR